MKPVIKWPGGKRNEIKYISDLVPGHIDKIVEPFFGGGAFSLEYINEYKVHGSDIDKDLVYFYKFVKSPSFRRKFLSVAKWWDGNLDISLAPKILKTHISVVKNNNKKTAKHTVYYSLRCYYNQLKLDNKYNIDRAIAFYMMRELSFSSMFRFNASGGFNVPYGGFSYNQKSLLAKYKSILELSKMDLNITNSDFINTIEKFQHDTQALIFLDPPYDSVFTDYNSNAFDRRDQIRLRDSIRNIKAKVIMIINKTDFIENLYNEFQEFEITEFEKKYSVNFKNRNAQKVKHLIITNFRRL